MKIAENNGSWRWTVYKLTKLIELAESLGDRELINQVLLVLLLIKYSKRN